MLPQLPQATALWKVGQRSFLVDHTVLKDGHEWDLIQTDSRMGTRKHETIAHPVEAMARRARADRQSDLLISDETRRGGLIMWRWYTAEDRRQAAGTGAVLILLGVAAVGMGPVVAGLIILTITGGTTGSAGLGDWPMITISLWRHPSDPAQAFGVDQLSPWGFWCLATLLIIGVGVRLRPVRQARLSVGGADRDRVRHPPGCRPGALVHRLPEAGPGDPAGPHPPPDHAVPRPGRSGSRCTGQQSAGPSCGCRWRTRPG